MPGEPVAFEPFWQDEFVLLVNPQFAVWALNGQTRQTMLGSAAYVTAPVYQLNDCASGVKANPSPCHLDYADRSVSIQNGPHFQATDKSVDLTPQEAAGLLKLDPFYATTSQSAGLDPGRAATVSSLGEYGMSDLDDKHDGTPQGYQLGKSFTISNDLVKATSQQYDMTVTDTVGSSQYEGFDLNFSGTQLKYTVTSGESTSAINQVQMVYTDSTAVHTETTTTSGDSLIDEDNVFQTQQGPDCPKCHDPLVARPKVAVYLDRTFGTLMFQDPDAPCGSFTCTSTVISVQPDVSASTGQPKLGTSGTQPLPLVKPKTGPVVAPHALP